MKMYYTYNEMKRAFETGRNFQLTGENNFQELIEELNQALSQPPVVGRSEQFYCLNRSVFGDGRKCEKQCLSCEKNIPKQ